MTTQGQQGAPVACTLAAENLQERHRQAASLFADGLVGADHYGDLLELRFRERYEPRVQELAAAERECCPFMDIEVRHDGRDVVLSLDCPPEAEATLNPFAAMAAEALAA